ncbi:helix-turn-helix domain-containing protein [Natronobeatus ordinarius]|uniref:helix-turn-helix domain-containing protein n=1 Tax=Natronobeatus ordinarius TaxID=2963433 RepID=UPI0020CF5EA8|nr:helix-turn-helix domain-containing protein [Natronobeatus ordinarius]
MINLELSVRQADCPLTAASGAYDVAFVTPHWHYHHERSRLELRVLAEAGDRDALESGLSLLRRHDELQSFELLAKSGATARARITMGTTHVMGVVVEHDGYVTAPFRNVDGRERWAVGFDDETTAETALEALRRHDGDEFVVRDRRTLEPATVLEDVRAGEVGTAMLAGGRKLTPTERVTIHRAVTAGYYDVPRSVTLGELAADLAVSDAAVSKTLRRAEAKLLEPALETLTPTDGDAPPQ